MGEELPRITRWKFELPRAAAIIAGIALARTGAASAAFRKVKGWLGYGVQEPEGTSAVNRPVTDTAGTATSPNHGGSPYDVSVPVTPGFLNVPRVR